MAFILRLLGFKAPTYAQWSKRFYCASAHHDQATCRSRESISGLEHAVEVADETTRRQRARFEHTEASSLGNKNP